MLKSSLLPTFTVRASKLRKFELTVLCCNYSKPGLIFEPIDKSLDVTVRQECRPCFIIELGPEEECTINNLKMIFTGPNKELDMKAFQEHFDYDMHGS
jgi:hypothetical protein